MSKGDKVIWESLGFEGEIIGKEPSLSLQYYRVQFERIGYVARVPETKLRYE